MNTIISAGSSGLFIMGSSQYQNLFQDSERVQQTQLQQYFNVHELCGGILAGLISISGSGPNVSLLSACAIGLIGAGIYSYTRKLFQRFEIDDPLDNAQIHGFCGIWSLFAVGLFDKDKGILYTGQGKFFLVQMVGIVSYSFWSLTLSFIFFYSLKKNDRLRLKTIYEIIGVDFLRN